MISKLSPRKKAAKKVRQIPEQESDEKRRTVRGKETRAWQAILTGSVLSALVEVVQLITRLGMLDVDDWVFNTVGTAAGYLLYRLFFRLNQKI